MKIEKLTHAQDLLLAMLHEIGTSSIYRKKIGKIGMPMEHAMALRDELSRRSEFKLFKRMSQNHLIKLEQRRGQMLAFLTNDGLIEVLKALAISDAKSLPKNEHVIVIFDVPERLRAARTALRKLLRVINFKMVQKSVWIGQSDVVRELRILVRLMGAEKYISVLHVTHGRYD